MNFSFVLPTYNRAYFLPTIIDALGSLDYPKSEYEIVIVNNNSNDGTAKLLKSLQKRYTNVQIVFEPRQGRTFASLAGMKAAKHTKIVFIDDDISVKKNLLQLYEKYFTAYPHAALIGGPILAKWSRPLDRLPWFVRLLGRYEPWIFGEIFYGKRVKKIYYPYALFAGNFALNLEQFVSIEETFYEALGRKVGKRYLYAEDYELCLRLGLMGKTQLYVPELQVENAVEENRATFRYLLQRLVNSGIENYIVDQKLEGFPKHVLLRPSLVGNISNFLKTRTRHTFIELLIVIPIWFGYNVYGPSTEKTARTQGIITSTTSR